MSKYFIVEENEMGRLMTTRLKLIALEHGGVDNWSYYSDSLNDFLKKQIAEKHLAPDCYWEFEDIVEKELASRPYIIYQP